MMRWLAIIVLFIAGGAYYQFYYPPMVLKHKTEAVLADFGKVIESKNRSSIGSRLEQLLTEQPKLHLDVFFLSFGQPDTRPVAQDFDKANFISFVDNIIFSLNDYGYQAELQNFNLSKDRTAADITFTSQEWGEGLSYYGGASITMHFSSTTICEGHVIFTSEKPQLDRLSCAMKLFSLPKPGEENKLQDPEVLRQFLR